MMIMITARRVRAILFAIVAIHFFVFFGCAELFEDATQCNDDRDCERFSGVCDVAHRVCIARSGGIDGGGIDPDAGPPITGNDATTDEPAFDKCNVPSPKPTGTIGVATAIAGEAEITGSVTLGCEKDWVLDSLVFVRLGATLTIEAGTTIRAKKGVGAGIIVSMGGRLVAEGRRETPIVITSEANPAASDDWRGVFVLGRAPPLGQAAYEDDPNLVWGGADVDDDSGVLSFLRIEYAKSGLVFAGAGRKTKVDFVQVRHPNENCFFFNGGTVNAKHLVCQAPGDEQFEFGVSYAGRAQFLFGQTNTPIGTFDANGILVDDASPVIYNATICGTAPGGPPRPIGYGLLFRNNATLDVNGVVLTGWRGGLEATGAVPTPGDLRASILFGNEANPTFIEDVNEPDPDSPTFNDDNDFNEIDFFEDLARVNAVTNPNLVACLDAKSPKPWPQASLTTNARTPPVDGFFDTTAKYIGAFKDQNDPWMKGAWLRFDDK